MTENTVAVLPGDGTGPAANRAAPDDMAVDPQTIVYARRLTRDLKIDLYRPAGDADARPVVVWAHGGGFFRGDRAKTPELLEDFRAWGLAVASIDYRLSREAHFPAQLHDVRAAVRHLRRNAGGLGLDPGAIGVWGASACGTLAALAGLLGDQEVLPGEGDVTGDTAVQAIAESYGAADLTASAPPGTATIPGMTGADSVEARLFGGTPAERPELAACAGLLTHVRAGAPPFQISHGTADPLIPWTHSLQLHTALAASDTTSCLCLLDGYRHGFLNSPRLADVDAGQLLHGGRLAAEGPARAQQHSSTHPADEGLAGVFGFDPVARFFRTHLQR